MVISNDEFREEHLKLAEDFRDAQRNFQGVNLVQNCFIRTNMHMLKLEMRLGLYEDKIGGLREEIETLKKKLNKKKK